MHEAILSLSLGWEIGGVGDTDVGAEDFHVLSPALLFGKGLGDLPDSLAYLRPLAVTGIFGAEVPLTSKEGNSLTYGVAIEYSLPYLQQFVKDIGIPPAAGRIFPVVELLFSTPIDGEEKWKTTGTVNPGLIWAGKFVEIGVEAIIPSTIGRARTSGSKPSCTSSWTTSTRPCSGRCSRRRGGCGPAVDGVGSSRLPWWPSA